MHSYSLAYFIWVFTLIVCSLMLSNVSPINAENPFASTEYLSRQHKYPLTITRTGSYYSCNPNCRGYSKKQKFKILKSRWDNSTPLGILGMVTPTKITIKKRNKISQNEWHLLTMSSFS